MVEIGINQTELKVILYILEVMEFGNLVNLNQRAICKALDLKPSNVSQIFKKYYGISPLKYRSATQPIIDGYVIK